MSITIELAENFLVLINLEPVDGRVSWLPASAKGFEPYNNYLILNDSTALLIDTGTRAHGDEIIRFISENIGDRNLVVFTTRSELECIGNIQRILCEFSNVQLVTSCPLDPMDLIHRSMVTRPHPPVSFLAFNESMEEFGFPEIVSVRPIIKTLGTGWLYDKSRGILFTSDSFGADLMVDEQAPPIRDTLENLPTEKELHDTMLAKFNWFEFANPSEFAFFWESTLKDRPVSVIAPNHGRIQNGAEVVEKVLADYRHALQIDGVDA